MLVLLVIVISACRSVSAGIVTVTILSPGVLAHDRCGRWGWCVEGNGGADRRGRRVENRTSPGGSIVIFEVVKTFALSLVTAPRDERKCSKEQDCNTTDDASSDSTSIALASTRYSGRAAACVRQSIRHNGGRGGYRLGGSDGDGDRSGGCRSGRRTS